MRVSRMEIMKAQERGEIPAPRTEYTRLHVTGWQMAGNHNTMILGLSCRDWGDVNRESTHSGCRQELWGMYEDQSGVRMAIDGGYTGEKSRPEGRGVIMCRAFLVVSNLTTLPGFAVLSVSGTRIGAGLSCVSGSCSSCQPLGTMAPKRAAPHRSRTASGRVCTREMTKEQEKAVHSAKHYRRSVPPEIQADIAKVEQAVWEDVNQGIPEPEFDDLAGWIHDPGKTYGRIGLYQRAISYYWASKCLLAKLLVDQTQRGKEQRAGVPIPLWDSHYNDSRLMHKKLDVLAYKLGIKFVAPEPTLTAKASARKGKRSHQASAQVP